MMITRIKRAHTARLNSSFEESEEKEKEDDGEKRMNGKGKEREREKEGNEDERMRDIAFAADCDFQAAKRVSFYCYCFIEL